VWRSTIGKKIVVAISGVILMAYVIVHALGNLKVIQGNGDGDSEPPVDAYSEFLRTAGDPAIPENGLLWLVRVILLIALVLHVAGIWQLTTRNNAARPSGQQPKRQASSLAVRTMLWTGIALGAFIVFHILHLTTRTIHPTDLAEGTVYANLHGVFQEWWLVAIYVAAVALLFFHLRHALWSVTQTWGIDKPNRNPTLRRGATITTVVVVAAFVLIPLGFLFDVFPDPVHAEVSLVR
jgi:succinate dehydrogenase / fumarate reductase cytochrome b subunit